MASGNQPVSGSGEEILQHPHAVEAALWRKLRFENNDKSREKLFCRFQNFARAVAFNEHRRRPPYGLERSDFLHFAYSGLLESIDRFDPLIGTPFEAFARRRIRGAITDGLTHSSEAGAHYGHRRKLETERLRSISRDPGKHSEDPVAQLSDLAVALALGYLIAHYKTADGDTLVDVIDDGRYGSIEWKEMQMSLSREMQRLPETERFVLEQHYMEDLAFSHIAKLLGVSKSRVSQLHRSALEHLRSRFRST